MPFKKHSPGGCRCCGSFSLGGPQVGYSSGPSSSSGSIFVYNGQSPNSLESRSTLSSFLEFGVILIGLDYVSNKWLVLNANSGSPNKGIWRCDYLLNKEDILWAEGTDIYELYATIKGNTGTLAGVDTAGCLLYDSFKGIGWFEKRRYSITSTINNFHKEEWEYVKVQTDGTYTETSTNESLWTDPSIFSGGWGTPSMDTSDETVYSNRIVAYNNGSGYLTTPIVFNDSAKSIPAPTLPQNYTPQKYAASVASYRSSSINTYTVPLQNYPLAPVYFGGKVFVGGASYESGPYGLIPYPTLYECTSSTSISKVLTFYDYTGFIPFLGTGLYNSEYAYYSTGNFEFFNEDLSIYFKLLTSNINYYYSPYTFACLSQSTTMEINNAFV